jgi:hypothetical protein
MFASSLRAVDGVGSFLVAVTALPRLCAAAFGKISFRLMIEQFFRSYCGSKYYGMSVPSHAPTCDLINPLDTFLF